MPFCIAGMHRSGTSVLTRMLNLCGCYLGAEADLVVATESNPEGHWENLRFVRLNDQVLEELGCGWDHWRELATGWHRNSHFFWARAQAGLLLQEFAGREPWGWKDPRNSLTLPLWTDLVPDLRIVVCLRNPLEVAASLRQRNFMSHARSLALWEQYNRSIWENTTPERRIVTHYSDVCANPRAELQRLLGFLEVTASTERLDGTAAACSREFRHATFTVGDLLDAGAPAEVYELYAHMCSECSGPEGKRAALALESFPPRPGGKDGPPWQGPVLRTLGRAGLEVANCAVNWLLPGASFLPKRAVLPSWPHRLKTRSGLPGALPGRLQRKLATSTTKRKWFASSRQNCRRDSAGLWNLGTALQESRGRLPGRRATTAQWMMKLAASPGRGSWFSALTWPLSRTILSP